MGQAKRKKKIKAIAAAAAIKLDIGCGKNKAGPEWIGIDILKFDGVDKVMDVRKTPWPWKAGTVDEIHTSHFVEHLTGAERIPFFNEAARVLKPGGVMRVICPNWSHDCAYGDPTHQWPPISAWFALYLNKAWRDGNAPHVGFTCDFDHVPSCNIDPWLLSRNDEFKANAVSHYINSMRDFVVTMTKRPPA